MFHNMAASFRVAILKLIPSFLPFFLFFFLFYSLPSFFPFFFPSFFSSFFLFFLPSSPFLPSFIDTNCSQIDGLVVVQGVTSHTHLPHGAQGPIVRLAANLQGIFFCVLEVLRILNEFPNSDHREVPIINMKKTKISILLKKKIFKKTGILFHPCRKRCRFFCCRPTKATSTTSSSLSSSSTTTSSCLMSPLETTSIYPSSSRWCGGLAVVACWFFGVSSGCMKC